MTHTHKKKNAHTLDSLLANGKLSGPEKDAVWNRLQATVHTSNEKENNVQRDSWWQRLRLPLAATCALLGVGTFAWMYQQHHTKTSLSYLASKGVSSKSMQNMPDIEIGCNGICTPGAQLEMRITYHDAQPLYALILLTDASQHTSFYAAHNKQHTPPVFTAAAEPYFLNEPMVIDTQQTAGQAQLHVFLFDSMHKAQAIQHDQRIHQPEDVLSFGQPQFHIIKEFLIQSKINN